VHVYPQDLQTWTGLLQVNQKGKIQRLVMVESQLFHVMAIGNQKRLERIRYQFSTIGDIQADEVVGEQR
jgi:hypothetical protein